MRHYLLVSEKKIKMLKTSFAAAKSIIGGATIFFNLHIYNKYIIFNTVEVMLCTDDAGRWILDAGP